MNPRYPNLTKAGFLTKRNHDLNPKLIEFINEVIAQMPHGLPINKEIRGDYDRDLSMETHEGQEPAVIPSLLDNNDRSVREFLYENTQNSPLRVITTIDPNDPENPSVYLERYPILIHDELIVYIHFFRTSDDPNVHTHPWRSAYSTILAGSYTETRLQDTTLAHKGLDGGGFTHKHRTAGSFGSLTNQTQHFVTLPQTKSGERACWTLFMHHRDWRYGWGFTKNDPVEAKVWDDLANNGEGEYKSTPGTLFVTKEEGGGANKKSWWTMEQGPSRFIDRASIIRERYGLTKESYL